MDSQTTVQDENQIFIQADKNIACQRYETNDQGYNETDNQEYNETDNQGYNETDNQEYNDTDNQGCSEADNQVYTHTDTQQHNGRDNQNQKEADNQLEASLKMRSGALSDTEYPPPAHVTPSLQTPLFNGAFFQSWRHVLCASFYQYFFIFSL